tara:strand:+ start:232 stop:1113 length:882 start_codon:yes stop_codon:yes gene_type:complete
MALPSSGAISIGNIATEFGGSQPHSLSEYYRNGSFVTSNNTNVPTSGTIDMADFYGAVKQSSVTISSSTTNLNVHTGVFGGDYTSSIPKLLIINSGVEIGASSLSNYALNLPSGMGGTLTIQNAGTISGAGGDGSSSGTGGTGGTAIYIASNNVTVTNTGTIRAGGGGGGKGANGASQVTSMFSCIGGTGGAGGNGQGYDQSQSNGAGGTARYAYLTYSPGSGNCAGPSCFQCNEWGVYSNGSSGGNGGTYGNAGSQGGGGGSQGGPAGKYIQNASGISHSLSNSGTLQGNAP